MARETKADRALRQAKARAARQSAAQDDLDMKVRVAIGFAAGYLGEKIATEFLPNVGDATVDLALAGGGAYLAMTRHDDLSDYATGAALVGTTQTLDRIWEAVRGFITPAGT